MADAKPYTKTRQLARGERRYHRKAASAKQWQKIIAEKNGPCRICQSLRDAGLDLAEIPSTQVIEYHHLLSRSLGGDDVADNIVPLCGLDHARVEQRMRTALRTLAESLTDAEYAYLIGKLGEGALERHFGVRFECVIDESAGLADA